MTDHIDQPLSIWYCDECHQAIHKPAEGMLTWIDSTDWRKKSSEFQRKMPNRFSIVHQNVCDISGDGQSMHLEAMLGVTGLQWWASNLWNGPTADPKIFNGDFEAQSAMDLLYRLQVPYYEQARQYFDSSYASLELSNRTVMSDEILKGIIENAGQAI
ncbi:hypothetical protein [Arthrobacter psychrolactophilus]